MAENTGIRRTAPMAGDEMRINNLIETHCHILPGIDDGSNSVETSLKMIHMLKKQGAKAIILTPHYYSDAISYQDFTAKRDNAFKILSEALSDDDPKLILGAEVYMSSYIFNYENLDKLCIGNTRYALIEHSFSNNFSRETFDKLMNINYDYNITPILAHIERYAALMEDEDLLDSYIRAGCLTQVNISSFASSHRSMRKKLLKYLEHGKIDFIGSDCHNLGSRAPEYEDGIKMIEKKLGHSAVERLINNSQILLK